ncbi:MAG: hypothetical protein ACI8W8_001264, partial [Rhodothermales bacterium]
ALHLGHQSRGRVGPEMLKLFAQKVRPDRSQIHLQQLLEAEPLRRCQICPLLQDTPARLRKDRVLSLLA